MTKKDRLPIVDQGGDEPRIWSRRDLLKIAGTAVASGTALASLAIVDRDDGVPKERLAKMKDHRVVRAPGVIELAIVRGPDAAANVTRAVEALGGMSAFVRPGERVVVKPNAGWNRLPEQAATTNPDVVAAVVRMVRAAGAAEIWVTDCPVNNAERSFERSGIRAVVGDAGANVILPEMSAYQPVEMGGKVLRVAEVLRPFVEADRVINVPIVKHHGLSRATMSMKNWYGVLGGHRVRLHQDIDRSIADLAQMMRPTLTILDATRILVANGPTGGNLADVKRLDTIAASTDEVALDAFGATLLGLEGKQLGFLVEGERLGLGRLDYRSLKITEVGA